jgi:DNA-binding NarL/FixJ family response regulator
MLMLPLRILIADDHALMRNSLAMMLSVSFPNAVVGEAVNGVDLVEKAKGAVWDIIITDVSMPVMNGLQALTAIRAIHEGLPVLLMSIHNCELHAAHAHNAGASGFISKNKLQEGLVYAIGQLLDKKKYFPDLSWQAK